MSGEVAISLLLSSASLHPGSVGPWGSPGGPSSPFGWGLFLGGAPGPPQPWRRAPGQSHHRIRNRVSQKLLPVG